MHIWDGDKLIFLDEGEHIHFWATVILVEKDGSLLAGTGAVPIVTNKGTLTIHLYGAPQNTEGKGIRCRTGNTCGVLADIWSSNVDADEHPGKPSDARKVSALVRPTTASVRSRATSVPMTSVSEATGPSSQPVSFAEATVTH